MKTGRGFKAFFSMVIFGLSGLLTASAYGAETFKLDPDHTAVVFRVKHLDVAYVYGRFKGPTGMFATIFYAILDPATGTLAYINGGHEPPVIIGSGGIKSYLNPTGPAVGLYPDLEFKAQTVNLEPQDSLVVYTDGVTDARSKSGESFSKERLLELLADPSQSAMDLIGSLKNRINAHILGENQFDDITILVLRRKE